MRRKTFTTLTLISLVLFICIPLLPSAGAQRRRPRETQAGPAIMTDQRQIEQDRDAIGPIEAVLPCCGKKPPLRDIPNYVTSNYSKFTGQIAIATNYADTPNKPSLVIWDLKNQAATSPPPPLGSQWNSSDTPPTDYYFHPAWTRASIGDIGGITLDNSGNIYAAATRVYGFNSLGSASVTPGTPGNGDIYKINGNTGGVTRFVQTAPANTYTSGNKLPNKGSGLGQITYSCDYDRLYVTNFEDGKIYQINPTSGVIVSTFDHGQKLPTATPARPAILDSATDGYTELGRSVWAVKVLNDRLYYSTVSEHKGMPANPPNEIWSVGLNGSGDFTGSAKLELTLPPLNAGGNFSNPVADISFNTAGTRMLLAERSMNSGTTPYAHESRGLECTLVAGVWTLEPLNKYTIGAIAGTNSAGGADYDDAPNGRTWFSGDALVLTANRVYGIQGFLGAPRDPNNSLLIDLDDDVSGYDKQWIGDVEIPCFQCDVVPPAPVIAPPDLGCAKPGQYCVKQAKGVSYTWNVTGGTPATANGSCVNITWGTTSPKAITVTATNAAGCTSVTRLLLNECAPPVDPCCPPWNKDTLKDVMFYQGSGSISAPYTLKFQPTNQLLNQIQTYFNYISSVNPAISGIVIDWTLSDEGTGNAPIITGTPIGPVVSTTWNATTAGNPLPNTNFFTMPAYSMQINRWYGVDTTIRLLPNGQTFFPEKCAKNGMHVRIQVLNAKTRSGGPVLEFSDGQRIIKTVPLTESREQLRR